MRFSVPLIRGRLVRRYKRFLADVTLDDGTETTVHCANPGAMLGLADPGAIVWIEPSDNPKRKLRYSWRLTETGAGDLVGIDTSLPNRLVAEALAAGAIPELAGYATYRPEVRYGTGSRVDFLASGQGLPDTYIEVKNVHLRRSADWAEFPDCVTARGAKHLRELGVVAQAGKRAVMLYVIQRTDCRRFRLAGDLDPAYASAFVAARKSGVEAIAYDTAISAREIVLGKAVPMVEPSTS